MAQTTEDASFGPVFVVAVVAILPKPQHRVFRRFRAIYTIKHKFSINKTRKKEKLTKWPKQRRTRRLGPFLSTPPSMSLLVPSKHQ